MFVKNPNLGADPNLGDFTVGLWPGNHVRFRPTEP